VVTATLTTGKVLDHLEMYVTTGVGAVLYDYIRVYAGTFIFSNAVNIKFSPPTRNAVLSVPGMIGSHKQSLGAEPASVEITVDPDFGNWKRTGDTVDGEVFADIAHGLAATAYDDWEWLDWGDGQMKVYYNGQTPAYEYGGDRKLITLKFAEYGNGKTGESYRTRFGFDL
jgi:hypothetical protein